MKLRISPEDYPAYVEQMSPRSPIWKDMLGAFCFGGGICALGQLILNLFLNMGLPDGDAGTLTSMSLILLSVLLTGLSLYDDVAKVAGAGTLVPITGFANSIAAPAIEFRSEKLISGTCVKLFSISGPVIVFGLSASVVYGIIYYLMQLV